MARGCGQLGVRAAFTRIAGATRRTFTVVDGRRRTSPRSTSRAPRSARPSSPGSWPTTGEAPGRGRRRWCFPAACRPGCPPTPTLTLIEAAAAAGVPVVLDAHGEALRHGAAAGPAIVKPNLAELEALAGRAPDGRRGRRPGRGGRRHGLQLRGARAVVVTLGPDGLLAVTGDGCWQARPPAVVTGNATGAGDAVTAALAHGLVLGRPWDERLRHAVALGAATVAAPVAGEFCGRATTSPRWPRCDRGSRWRPLMPLARHGRDHRPRPGRGPRGRRVQRHRHRARRGDRARRRGGARPGGAPDQRELRRLPRRAGPRSRGLPGRRGRGRGARRGAPGPRLPRDLVRGGGPARPRLGHVRRVRAALRRERPRPPPS